MLQNCHLGLKYMNALFESYKADIAAAQNQNEKKDEDAEKDQSAQQSHDKKKEKTEKVKTVHPDYRL